MLLEKTTMNLSPRSCKREVTEKPGCVVGGCLWKVGTAHGISQGSHICSATVDGKSCNATIKPPLSHSSKSRVATKAHTLMGAAHVGTLAAVARAKRASVAHEKVNIMLAAGAPANAGGGAPFPFACRWA